MLFLFNKLQCSVGLLANALKVFFFKKFLPLTSGLGYPVSVLKLIAN